MGASGRSLIEARYTWRHYHARIAALHQAVLDGASVTEALDAAGDRSEARA
jgi:hypothetical protein